MLQQIASKHPPHRSPNSPPRRSDTKVVNLSLIENAPGMPHSQRHPQEHSPRKTSLQVPAFRTFYSTENSPRWRRGKGRKAGRATAMEQRQSIEGTPLTSIDIQHGGQGATILHMERQRYRHYLHMVGMIEKGNTISHIRYPSKPHPNPEKYSHPLTMATPQQSSQRVRDKKRELSVRDRWEMEYGAPRIINIQAEVVRNSRRKERGDPNPFQTTFKNKMRLKGRYGIGGGSQEKLFGQEQGFSITKARQARRQKKAAMSKGPA